MIRDAVENCAHAVLANTKPNVASAGIIAVKITAVLDVIHSRSVQISAAAHQHRHGLGDRLQRFAAGFARGQLRIRRKLGNLRQEVRRNFSFKSVIEQLCSNRIFLAPRIVSFFPAIVLREQLFFVVGEVGIYILRDEVMFLRQPERLACGIDKFCASFAMRFVRACDFRDAFADERVRDDELWFPVVAPLRHLKGVEELLHVMSVDFLHIKPVCFKAFAGVFALGLLRRGIERDGV